MIYTLTLNPAIDYRMNLGHLTPDATNVAESATVSFGGKGINVSLVLRELGVDSIALGFVAGFTGHALEAHLRGMGLTTDFIHLSDGMTRINVKLWSEGEETEINAPGPRVPTASMNALMGQLTRLETGDTLVMAGRIPSGLPTDIYASFAESVTKCGVRVVIDTTRDALRATLPCRPFLIKPNLCELEDVVRRTLRHPDGSPDWGPMAQAAEELHTAGAQNVLVTLGKYGAYLLDADGQSHRQSAPAGEIKGTVGAGDSTIAGFLAGIDRGWDTAQALRLAVAAGSATAMSEGLATQVAVDHLLARMQHNCASTGKEI